MKHARMRRIKMKMLSIGQTPREVFEQLDEDKGGGVSRKEMAMGLYRLGVRLVYTPEFSISCGC